MNSAYLQLKGRRVELNRKRTSLINGAKASGRAIKDELALLGVTSLEDIDADSILHHAQELKRQKDELAEINRDLRKIKKELGED